MDVDGRVDELIMERLEQEEKDTEWILILDEPVHKKFVSKDNPNYFKELVGYPGPDGKTIWDKSTYKQYDRKEEWLDD